MFREKGNPAFGLIGPDLSAEIGANSV